MVKALPQRPMMGGTRNGLRPERYDYWRVGHGTPESYALEFWVERAGEYHGKPPHISSHDYWTHTTQLFYHLDGEEAIFEYPGAKCRRSKRRRSDYPP